MTFQHRFVRCCKKFGQDIWQLRLPLVLITLYLLFTNLLFGTSCPYVIFFGRSCPACGLTRSGILVLTGHFSEAFALNPTIYLWGPLLFYGFLYRYILDKKAPLFFLLAVITGILTILWFLLALYQGIRVPVSYDGLITLLIFYKIFGIIL